MIAKLQDHHRQRPAYVYIRQSTPGQVRHHQESTDRQYALQNKAMELGWAPSQIQLLDRDLGRSGARFSDRQDFKLLVSDVSMSQVGAVFALEASRLARSCLDWHRLIEICSLTQTLVIDEEGCYDPADFNDALLLGLKGTIAQAEHHYIRERLHGAKLNKARRGELRFPLPVGLVHDDTGQVVLDPDEEVQGAVRLVFTFFRQTGSAYGTVHAFTRKGLRFPKRAFGGVWRGKLVWDHLTHARVLGVLKNPAYAGAYVFGRHRGVKQISPEGAVTSRTVCVPRDSWKVCLLGHHEGYLPWEEYLENQHRLEQNRTNAEATLVTGCAREGLALLPGVLLCRRCGRKLTVRYTGNGGLYPLYLCSWQRRDGLATRECLALPCAPLDAAVAERALHVLEPARLQLALDALHELEARDQSLCRQWRMRVERAHYEAELAQRRYEEVDPSNRLVAATLEKRWNETLVRVEELEKSFAEFQGREALAVTAEQKAQLLALAEDFPRLWHAPSTSPKDRKRMLRLLIKDIAVERPESSHAVLHIRWQGGLCEDLRVDLPRPMPERIRYPAELVERVRCLAQDLSDEQIASLFNREGRRSPTGKPYSSSMVRWIRYTHHIASPPQRQPAELSVNEVAQRLAVNPGVVYYWIARGMLAVRQPRPKGPCWITLDAATEADLRERIHNSPRLTRQPMRRPS